jgi:hypothetical protein
MMSVKAIPEGMSIHAINSAGYSLRPDLAQPKQLPRNLRFIRPLLIIFAYLFSLPDRGIQ